MSTYKEIHGKAVKTLSSDPTDDGAAGQVWYNTTSETFKTVVNLEAWRSASIAVTQMHAGQGFGTQTDAVGAGGYDPGSSPGYVANCDEYNGNGWASGTNIGTTRYTGSGCGSQTAGLIAGGTAGSGNASLEVEEYNGTSWAEQTDLSTGHGYGWMAGIQTAAICYSGLSDPSPAAITVNAEEYNGSSWTEVGNVNTGKYGILGFGATKDTAVKVGGTSANTGVEEYNGTSWTAVTSIPANRADGMGSGSQTAGLLVAGNPGGMTSTLTYDGTNWTTSPATLSETRAANARGATITGNATGIIHHAGPGAPKMKLTEEYDSSATAITAAAFASGGNLNTARYDISGTGLQTAAVAAGGYSTARVGTTENYDGTAWTNSSTKPTAVFAGAMAGTQTASFYASGNSSPGGGRTPSTEEYDGSNWTSGGAVNTARQQIAAQNGGTLTAGIIFGGNGGTTATEDYNGTAWTTQPGTLNDGRWNGTGTGSQTAAVLAGADNPATANVEEYNGTSWSEQTNIPQIRYSGACIGTSQTDYFVVTGQAPGPAFITNNVRYDGTSWATSPSNATARSLLGGSSQAPTAAGIIYGGYTVPTLINATEEFTGETSALNVKTLTQS